MSVTFQKDMDKSLGELGGASPILVFAISWENKTKEGLIDRVLGKKYDADLDLSCVMYDHNNDRIDCIWYAQLNSKCGSLRHKGDDTVGWHEGDDEAISIDLNQINDEARTLFFVISSFSNDSFAHVDNPFWHIFDGQTKREIGRYNLACDATSTAKIVMRMQKTEKDGIVEWRVRAMDEPATGQNIQEIFPEIRSLIEV